MIIVVVRTRMGSLPDSHAIAEWAGALACIRIIVEEAHVRTAALITVPTPVVTEKISADFARPVVDAKRRGLVTIMVPSRPLEKVPRNFCGCRKSS